MIKVDSIEGGVKIHIKNDEDDGKCLIMEISAIVYTVANKMVENYTSPISGDEATVEETAEWLMEQIKDRVMRKIKADKEAETND